mgnify:FL=1|jgi:chromosomal replication initiation ATPase DnaA
MQKELFDKYVTRVCKLYNIRAQELYTKKKTTELADARHLLYFLCKETPIKTPYIQKFMRDNGYEIDHSSIYHGHKKLLKKIEDDGYMKQVVEDIRNECTN